MNARSVLSMESIENFVKVVSHSVAVQRGFYTDEVCRKEGKDYANALHAANNPGGLKVWGSFPIENGLAQFDSLAAGWRALNKTCSRNVFERELSFYEFFHGQRDAAGRLLDEMRSYEGFDVANAAACAKQLLNVLTEAFPRNSPVDIHTKIHRFIVG